MSSPRWIIDEKTQLGRVFCEDSQAPRLVGELLAYDDAPERGFFFHAPDNRLLCNVQWLDDDIEDGIVFETLDMTNSLRAALEEHAAAKGETKAAINRRTPNNGGPA